MAALQSRATHRLAQRHANDEGEAEVIRGRPQQQRIIREQDSWILFAPVKPAQAQLTEHTRSPIDSRITSSSQDTAQAAAHEIQNQGATANNTGRPADDTQTSHDGTPLSPPLLSSVEEIAGEASVPSPTISNDTPNLPSPEPSSLGRWTILPTPNASYLFDDEQDAYASPKPSRQEYSPVESLRVAGSAVSANTELLSIPSSVTLSERSASTNASPRRVNTTSSHARHRQEPSDALTAAALSKMTATEDNLSKEEADLTSGSEEEDAMDVDEALLARAPDAMSAGIRPIKRAPLQRMSVSAASQSQGQHTEGGLPSTSARLSTSSKRRHRKAGTSEKGSKRSQTTSEAPSKASKGKQAIKDRKTKDASGRRSRRPTFSLGEAARQIFQLDREVLEAFSQHGSVYHQSLPQDQHRDLRSDRSLHGYEAFAAQTAFEVGDSPHSRYMFTGAYPEDSDSIYHGDTVEDFERRFDNNHEAYLDYHTASLGLHRHFSLSTLHHFLVESVYNSLPSLSKTSTTNPSNVDHDGRRRASSINGLHREHGVAELQNTLEQDSPRIDGYHDAVTYWRRILRSFVA